MGARTKGLRDTVIEILQSAASAGTSISALAQHLRQWRGDLLAGTVEVREVVFALEREGRVRRVRNARGGGDGIARFVWQGPTGGST